MRDGNTSLINGPSAGIREVCNSPNTHPYCEEKLKIVVRRRGKLQIFLEIVGFSGVGTSMAGASSKL